MFVFPKCSVFADEENKTSDAVPKEGEFLLHSALSWRWSLKRKNVSSRFLQIITVGSRGTRRVLKSLSWRRWASPRTVLCLCRTSLSPARTSGPGRSVFNATSAISAAGHWSASALSSRHSTAMFGRNAPHDNESFKVEMFGSRFNNGSYPGASKAKTVFYIGLGRESHDVFLLVILPSLYFIMFKTTRVYSLTYVMTRGWRDTAGEHG